MKIERTKNAVRNIKAGLILRVYQTIAPFLMRTAMIYFMGVQYLGLNSLFASILQVLNMAEMGIGHAMVYAMYKPIAQDDEQTICGLMWLYRKYYRVIGSLIALVGLILTPVVPHLITGEVPAELNVYALYLLNLGATVLTYWLFAYKNCLLQAHQRSDITNWITSITYTAQCVAQLGILLFLKNYYLYVIVSLGTQALNNILTAIVVTRKYPNYKPVATLSPELVREINGKIRDLFTAKLGAVVLKSSDTIVISAFLGLVPLAIYQNYFFIVGSVLSVLEIILSSMMAGLGNSFVLETKEKIFQNLQKFTFLFLWLIGVCTCCFLAMYQPFMEIWVGPELMLGFGEVICFAAYFFIYTFNRLLSIYKDAAGLWHEDRFRPLVTAFVNLGLNLLTIRFWGIYGVLLSTVIAIVLVEMPWVLHNLFTYFFEKRLLGRYLKQLLCQIPITVAAGTAVCLICSLTGFSKWPQFFFAAAVAVVVPNLLFYVALRKHPQFGPGVRFLDRVTKKKLGLARRLL